MQAGVGRRLDVYRIYYAHLYNKISRHNISQYGTTFEVTTLAVVNRRYEVLKYYDDQSIKRITLQQQSVLANYTDQ